MDTFQGQVHSPGVVGAMESLTTQIQILEEEAHIAKEAASPFLPEGSITIDEWESKGALSQ